MAQENKSGKPRTMEEQIKEIQKVMTEYKQKMEIDPEFRARAEEGQRRWGEIVGYDQKK